MAGPAPLRPVWSLLLAGAVLLGSTAASDMEGRYNALNHQMMCTCGCAQLLGECNHVGCPNSPGMLKTLRADLAGGMSDRSILEAFAQSYGPEALASPLLTRFNQAAWFVPPAVLVLGIFGALLLVRRWRRSKGALIEQAPVLTGMQAEALARVRRETSGG